MNQKSNKIEKPNCPECNSVNVIKSGKRKNKLQTIQLYSCKDCSKRFPINSIKNKSSTYPIDIILNSISYYNLGYSLNKTSQLINKIYKTSITQKTIHNWINKYNLPYKRLREKAVSLYSPRSLIFKETLDHNQVYLFQYHKAKLDLILNQKYNRKFNLIKYYLESIPTNNFPHKIFKYDKNALNSSRISELNIETLNIKELKKQNYSNILTSLALNLAKGNNQRHQKIQEFFLINDSTTVAVEIPVYLTNEEISYFKNKGFSIALDNYKAPITGHIDIIQLRNNAIHILDYKPEADRNFIAKSSIRQLALYALALASKTKIAVKDFKCAFFNENFYHEFFPLQALYKLEVDK